MKQNSGLSIEMNSLKINDGEKIRETFYHIGIMLFGCICITFTR